MTLILSLILIAVILLVVLRPQIQKRRSNQAATFARHLRRYDLLTEQLTGFGFNLSVAPAPRRQVHAEFTKPSGHIAIRVSMHGITYECTPGLEGLMRYVMGQAVVTA